MVALFHEPYELFFFPSAFLVYDLLLSSKEKPILDLFSTPAKVREEDVVEKKHGVVQAAPDTITPVTK